MDIIEQLEQLMEQAEADITNLHSTYFFEPALVQVLEFIKSHPDDWPRFKAYFIADVMKHHQIPQEVFEFCMHALRWPEVHAAVKKRQQDASNPIDPRFYYGLAGHRAAFNDDWDGAEMYLYFGRSAVEDPFD